MYKKQVCLFYWDYMINNNKNEGENEKYHKDTHSVHPLPFCLGDVWASDQIFKGGGAWQDLSF